MAEMLHVRVMNTGEECTIPDVEPLESAKLFWQISDSIWRQKPEQSVPACFRIASAVPTLEARDALNDVLGDIDEELIVSGVGKAIKLNGFRPGEEIELTPGLLDNPIDAHVGTFNWDKRNTWRYANIDGKTEGVTFTDGHKDYHRELYAGFDYRDEDHQTVQLTYAMQRIQYAQDHLTSLSMSIWHSQYAETGYEGNNLKLIPLSVEQELRVLHVFQAIGGLTLENQ